MITIHTIEDIRRLLTSASAEERHALAEVLDMSLDKAVPGARKNAESLVRQLWWKYQTPLGYLTRDPSFDEICVDVAKKLKLGGLAKEEGSCWTLLANIASTLLEQLLDKMEPEAREKLAREILTPEQFRQFGVGGRVDWGKVTGGAVLLAVKQFGGFATYKVAVIVANQVSRALLRHGLSLAANAAIARGISLVLGPVGWILLVWSLNDLFGTNYKRVIPAVLFISSIYERLKAQDQLPF